MFHHVGEWSRVVAGAGDYRHHPLVSIFYLCFDDTTFSHCIVTLYKVIGLAGPPPASSHRAPFMISFSFHAATEHSEFNSLVMYARRKIFSGSDMFSTTGYLDGSSPFLAENGARPYGVPDRLSGYVVSVYVLM
jgi:hypothetical protein